MLEPDSVTGVEASAAEVDAVPLEGDSEPDPMDRPLPVATPELPWKGELEPVADPLPSTPEPSPDGEVDPLPLLPLVGSPGVGVATVPPSSVQP